MLWTAGAIHGDRTQAERTQALHRFTTKAVRVLVATDVAARGLDIKVKTQRPKGRRGGPAGRASGAGN